MERAGRADGGGTGTGFPPFSILHLAYWLRRRSLSNPNLKLDLNPLLPCLSGAPMPSLRLPSVPALPYHQISPKLPQPQNLPASSPPSRTNAPSPPVPAPGNMPATQPIPSVPSSLRFPQVKLNPSYCP